MLCVARVCTNVMCGTRVRLRRAAAAEAEADVESVGGAEMAQALWRARCDLAAAPTRLERAFPGVRCCDAAQALKERRHPLRPDTGGWLVGQVFEHDGKRWCVEELAVADDAGGVGLYAYDATRYASATLRLEERCKLFGEEALRALEQRRDKQECARRQAEALLGPSPAGWAAAETGAAAESGHGEGVEWDAVTGRPAAAMPPPRDAADVGGQARGVAAGAGEPLASERAREADGHGGGRRVAARLDAASALRDALLGEARAAGCGGAGAASAVAAGEQSSAGEAAGAAAPMGSAAGGAGEKRSRGEASGEAEAAASKEKRPRGDKGRRKSGKQRAAERKQRAGQR